MNDLRHDPDELPIRGYSAVDDWVLRQHAMPAESLRTVPMPDLRTPDAEARDLRTAGDKLAELTRQVGTLQAVCSELSRRVAALEARPLDVAMRLDDLAAKVDMLAARVDMLAARPLAMAEDAWGVG